MRGYFTFEWTSIAAGGPLWNVGLLFKAPGPLSEGDLADAIEGELQRSLYPDVLALLCAQDEFASLELALKNSTVLVQARTRASTRTSVLICTYNRTGDISKVVVVDNNRAGLVQLIRRSSSEIRAAGVQALFAGSGILVEAPPGFVFVKPSGSRSRLFLRTEEALFESERAEFLAFALLPLVARREAEARSPLEAIYIDSMAIASVAYALRDSYSHLYQRGRPRVVSFHSYGGFEAFESPLRGTALCIISASSSMNLEHLWLRRTGCYSSEIVTLVTLDSANGANAALHVLPHPEHLKDQLPEHLEALHDLRIVGERFSPENIPPKKVVLRKLVHTTGSIRELPSVFAKQNVLSVHGAGNVSGAKSRPLFVSGSDLSRDPMFEEFVRHVIDQETPASVQGIIFQDDAASQALARMCHELLSHRLGGKPIGIWSEREVAKGTASVDRDCALLIVAMVAGKGTRLLSITRDLRDAHLGARTYLVGAQIGETSTQAQLLASNLRFSSSGANVIVRVFRAICTGRGVGESYMQEGVVLRDCLPESLLASSGLGARLTSLDRFGGLTADAFLPSGSSLRERLELRKDFAFWDVPYKPGADVAPTVLATVAATLQYARETRFDNAKDRLSTDAFQQVVLDPENFTRFNDGVIQAAILRSAYSSELDFSCDEVASEGMLGILQKIFTQCEKPQGEAAMEFAFAIASGKLKLRPKCMDALRESLREDLGGRAYLHKALRLLLGIDKLRGGRRPANF